MIDPDQIDNCFVLFRCYIRVLSARFSPGFESFCRWNESKSLIKEKGKKQSLDTLWIDR